ncbi:3',5'-cyclic adenosine monophosphate phosphodiesterase CpdA [Paenibacillus allorhizoplanae]|uniref:3',5'-cyclic adenosine monophosphate phosphodiesterase CpdA n=1 Tax=Paenibacillus allorhizoplanae TaxID=2905648 RepID=A0ABN8HBI6_9BACL|nr:metallophosphoesterase [Paenibacillus allorhizoplanae]CAH1227927.1 3',5'-cyclic adenosine monophosphate phosphodiesterase CpdA [Paenibacillus allorhizoplanae]
MISRRQFIKRLLATAFAVTGVGALLKQALKGPESNVEVADASEEQIIPQASAQPVSVDSTNNQLLLSFFLLSDVHISNNGTTTIIDKLHSALKDITRFESPVDTIVFGGDITDVGRDQDYKLFRKVLDNYKLPPLYANMGNHDYYDIWISSKGDWSAETVPNGKTDAMSRERFMKFFGYKDKPYKDVWMNDVHLIMLSQETYVQENPEVGEGAWYSDEQLAWLENCMKSHEDGKPAFIFIHQPLPAPEMDGKPPQLLRAKEFRAILAPYKNVFVLSGHTHRNFATENHYNTQNSFHWFNNASVGKTRSTDNPNCAQGMYVQIFNNEVVVRGREFSDRTWIESAIYTVPMVHAKQA